MRSLMWFREDLRVTDNTALHYAACNSLVIAVYVIDLQAWRRHAVSRHKVDFICRHLKQLAIELAELNISLQVIQGVASAAIPHYLVNIAKQYQCSGLFYNEQYEIDEISRDQKVKALFKEHGLAVYSYHDQVIIPPGEILSGDKRFYSMFTPFKKAWINYFNQQHNFTLYPKPKSQENLKVLTSMIPDQIKGFISELTPVLWPAGEQAAQIKLQTFVKQVLTHYDDLRNFPAAGNTSQLSPYLAIGVISPRQCLKEALDFNQGQLVEGNSGAIAWINELLWREFYKHILKGYPRVSMNRAFLSKTEKIKWINDEKSFIAWQEGRTGYPIIDAAMRQLKAIGWMHNRLRMLSAMFLTKLLLVDWRWGERYFIQSLIDGDLAANNGNWQWCASTGANAVPYFRIFNPTVQSQKFDPQGEFIKSYCPELNQLTAKEIHLPSLSLRKTIGYCSPIVAYKEASARYIKMFSAL